MDGFLCGFLQQMTPKRNKSTGQSGSQTVYSKEKVDAELEHCHPQSISKVTPWLGGKERGGDQPILLAMTRKYLCIPTSTALIEGVFSASGPRPQGYTLRI